MLNEHCLQVQVLLLENAGEGNVVVSFTEGQRANFC